MDMHANARTHATRALIDLRQRILSGGLAGGTRLFEVPLAEELDISRTPLREALSRLAAEGLLDRAPGGGFVVRSFALADVIDTIELRGVLEGTAARLAAERGVAPERMQALRGILARLDECFGEGPDDVDFESYSDLNTEFHAAIAELAGSAVLSREIARVTRLPFASPSAFLPDSTRLDAFRRTLSPAQEQHRALVEAIGNREGTRAEMIAREHARAARRNVEYIFATDPGLKADVPGLALITG